MPLSITSYINQIVAGQPRIPGPIKNALQAVQNWASAGLVNADIASNAAIAYSKLSLAGAVLGVDLNLDRAKVYMSGNQGITTGAATVITFNSEVYDSNTIHDNSTNNSRLTAKRAGTYLVLGFISWGAHATGFREAILKKNGTTNLAHTKVPAVTDGGTDTLICASVLVQLALNDYVELLGQHTAGTTINAQGGSESGTHLAMTLLSIT